MTAQSNELQFFYPVQDCATCTQSFDNQTTAVATNCEFCLANGDDCVFESTNSTNESWCSVSVVVRAERAPPNSAGCELPDTTHVLFGFETAAVVNSTSNLFADLATSELCCYWLTNTSGVYDVA